PRRPPRPPPLPLHDVLPTFSPDATVADPVDQPEMRGAEAVRDIFATTHANVDSLELQITGPIRAVGRWAAVPLRAVTTASGGRLDRKSTRLNSRHVKISYAG